MMLGLNLNFSLAAMMPGIILVVSLAALLQFFISYCRSLIAASVKQALSVEVRDVTGIARTASGEDFERIIQLLRLCPAHPHDRSEIRAIGTYFRLLGFLCVSFGKLIPSLESWTETERGQCAYFAAVALERRIAFSRDMFAEQMHI
jgi:hypothetical protein